MRVCLYTSRRGGQDVLHPFHFIGLYHPAFLANGSNVGNGRRCSPRFNADAFLGQLRVVYFVLIFKSACW